MTRQEKERLRLERLSNAVKYFTSNFGQLLNKRSEERRKRREEWVEQDRKNRGGEKANDHDNEHNHEDWTY